MNIEDLQQLVRQFRESQDRIMLKKGDDYTHHSEDRLYNFKEVARLSGLTPLQVWSVYWLKHITAICTFVQFGQLKSEDILSRFLDEQNYTYLGLALIIEEQQNATPLVHPLRDPTGEKMPPFSRQAGSSPLSPFPKDYDRTPEMPGPAGDPNRFNRSSP